MKPTEITAKGDILDSIDRSVFFTAAALIVLFCVFGGVFSSESAVVFARLQNWLVVNVGWYAVTSPCLERFSFANEACKFR